MYKKLTLTSGLEFTCSSSVMLAIRIIGTGTATISGLLNYNYNTITTLVAGAEPILVDVSKYDKIKFTGATGTVYIKTIHE